MNKNTKKRNINYILIEEYNVNKKENLQKIFNKKLYNLIMTIENNYLKYSNY